MGPTVFIHALRRLMAKEVVTAFAAALSIPLTEKPHPRREDHEAEQLVAVRPTPRRLGAPSLAGPAHKRLGTGEQFPSMGELPVQLVAAPGDFLPREIGPQRER